MKKIISLALAIVLIFALALPAMAADGKVSTLTASYSGSTVTFSGTTSSVNAAVAVQVLNGSNILGMTSVVVSSNAFSGTITDLTLTNGETYTVRAADYDGGEWKTCELVVTATYTPVVTPVEDVKTDAVTATVSDGKATVTAVDTSKVESGEVVTLDFSDSKTDVTEVQLPTEAVKAISEASDQGVEIKLTDVDVKLDAAALESLAEAIGGKDVSLSVKVGSEVMKELTADQNKVIGAMKDTVVISAAITSDGKNISDFGGGTVELTVDYKWNGKGVLRAAFVKDDGTVEIVPVTFADGKATISVRHFSNYVIYTEDKPCDGGDKCSLKSFTDLDTSEWYHDSVHFCVENGIMNGTSDTTFDPAGTTTRAQLITMLWRLEGKPYVNYLYGFKDVESEQWYTEAIRWAAAEKIVNGYDAETFGTNDPVTREQAAAILYRYANYKGIDIDSYTENVNTLSFDDVFEISEFAAPGMHFCIAAHILQGSDNQLRPRDFATRVEMSAIIMRFDGLFA